MRVVLAVAAAGILGCAGPAVVGKAPGGAPIIEVPLRQSSVYLLRTATPVLVDAGTLGDEEDLRTGLAAVGADPFDVRLVVITHAHHDHAGLAASLQRSGAIVMLGAGDADLAKQGQDDDLRPTGLM